MDKEQLLKEREERVETAVTMGVPDRVPWVPMVSGFYMLGYQVSFYDFMKDPRTVKEGVRKFCQEYERWMSGTNSLAGDNFHARIRDQVQKMKHSIIEGEHYKPYQLRQ